MKYQVKCRDNELIVFIIVSCIIIFAGFPILFFGKSGSIFHSLILFEVICIPLLFFIFYVAIMRTKETMIITLTKKNILKKHSGKEGEIIYYYFHATIDNKNKVYETCKKLFDSLNGNETVQIVIRGDRILGLVKVILFN